MIDKERDSARPGTVTYVVNGWRKRPKVRSSQLTFQLSAGQYLINMIVLKSGLRTRKNSFFFAELDKIIFLNSNKTVQVH